jgi:hypothetical protein
MKPYETKNRNKTKPRRKGGRRVIKTKPEKGEKAIKH